MEVKQAETIRGEFLFRGWEAVMQGGWACFCLTHPESGRKQAHQSGNVSSKARQQDLRLPVVCRGHRKGMFLERESG